MSEWTKLVEILIWPLITVIILILVYPHLRVILKALTKRIDAGAKIVTPWLTVDIVPTTLDTPGKDELVTHNHMALIHSSWRYPKKDKEFQRPVYAFHAVIQAQDSVLDRIEFVRYTLSRSYPNPIQTSVNRQNRFKLKELAWGESILRAEVKVKVKGQDDLIKLSRYINLTQTGPRI
jgi:hypothetical protein